MYTYIYIPILNLGIVYIFTHFILRVWSFSGKSHTPYTWDVKSVKMAKNNGVWYKKFVSKIAPPEPVHSGSCTTVTGFLKFDENI